MKNNTVKKPTIRQLEAMRHRYEISGSKLIVKNKYPCGPEVGKRAGSPMGGDPKRKGYLQLRVLGGVFLVHQIVWFLTRDMWPTEFIKHVDGDRSNNSPENLRQAFFILEGESRVFLGYFSDGHDVMRAYHKRALELGYLPDILS